jgi:hypothetical protein
MVEPDKLLKRQYFKIMPNTGGLVNPSPLAKTHGKHWFFKVVVE